MKLISALEASALNCLDNPSQRPSLDAHTLDETLKSLARQGFVSFMSPTRRAANGKYTIEPVPCLTDQGREVLNAYRISQGQTTTS